jgi:hypothetical protein
MFLNLTHTHTHTHTHARTHAHTYISARAHTQRWKMKIVWFAAGVKNQPISVTFVQCQE